MLYGAGTYLMFISEEQPAASVPFQFNIPLVENTFRLPSGFPATREQIMQVLQSLSAIYIRATYWQGTLTARYAEIHSFYFYFFLDKMANFWKFKI